MWGDGGTCDGCGIGGGTLGPEGYPRTGGGKCI